MKLHNSTKKYILKETFKSELPAAVFDHKKTGFSIPLEDWLRSDLKEFMLEVLAEDRIKKAGFFEYSYIKRIINQHLSGKRNYKTLIWRILMFQLWHEKLFSQTHPLIKAALKGRGLN
jgi:asparagine synthase (glutamine-hydrolysing)